MIYCNYDIHLRAAITFAVIYMEMNWKNTQVSMQIQTNYRSSCAKVTELLFYRFRKIPRKATAVESYLSRVTGLTILLKQDPTTDVFMKTCQNFQNRCFLCHASKWLLLNLQTILIVPAPSSLPHLYVGTRGVEQFRIICWTSSRLTIH